MRPAALITGGAKRVGKGIAQYLAAHGYDIALHYNASKIEAEETAQAITAKGAVCTLFQADLTDPGAYDPLIAKAKAAFPQLTALVNNASAFDRGHFLESEDMLFRTLFRSNFEAPVFLTRAFARQVEQGAVVNMLDTCITQNKHSHFYYLLTKKALHEFTRMAAVELAPHIRVNGVAPGYILPSEYWGDEYRKQLEARLPMKKIATAEDVAQAVHVLLSTPSLTGQVLFVDGGEHLL